MPQEFLGYHSEWNMGSPGGWDYQRMAQDIGKLAWKAVREKRGVDVELDFDSPILNPVPNFAGLLLRAHKAAFPAERPFIALVAEEETLERVGENIRFVEYLNGLHGVQAVLIAPAQLELRNGRVCAHGSKVTAIFLDFNNNVILKLKKRHDIKALLTAIKQGIVVNPRGMEPLGVKGVFEMITSECGDKLSESTVRRTPWTRQFYPRGTTGPNGEEIPDLVKWVSDNWHKLILKPVHGYSGRGIIVCYKEHNKESAIQAALKSGDYIAQLFIPLEIWTEEFPWLDTGRRQLYLRQCQTDFRCFVTDAGLMGFVTRFGGIPTNVGSGGGVQSTAILRSDIPVDEAAKIVNDAVLSLGYGLVSEIQEALDKRSVEIGSVYLLGPIKCTLRPRIITEEHITQLEDYSRKLWRDAVILEEMWLGGSISKYVRIDSEEEGIARMAPWRGGPALIASDGLFGFQKIDL